jgi:hypothetical protein
VPKCISKYVSQSRITRGIRALRPVPAGRPAHPVAEPAGWSSSLRRPAAADCAAAPVCTADEELTNYANWYAYYRTRS